MREVVYYTPAADVSSLGSDVMYVALMFRVATDSSADGIRDIETHASNVGSTGYGIVLYTPDSKTTTVLHHIQVSLPVSLRGFVPYTAICESDMTRPDKD